MHGLHSVQLPGHSLYSFLAAASSLQAPLLSRHLVPCPLLHLFAFSAPLCVIPLSYAVSFGL